MVPDSFPLKKHTIWDFPGGTGIISPRGDYLAGPIYGKEDIVYAEIDPSLIIRAKAVIDGVGHFSRPDILKLEIKGYDPAHDGKPEKKAEPAPPRKNGAARAAEKNAAK
ncbi:MAG: hypothetical protein KJ002_14070, partial [Candidatus Dadabacteria bacterium]|nr:hypothetical protein [Candidatus Dadabacteria bacterium]